MATKGTEAMPNRASSKQNTLPNISPLEANQRPASAQVSSQLGNTTRNSNGSGFEKLPTLHPELEGYTPGEFSLRVSKTICQGLSSQQTKLRSAKALNNALIRKESLEQSIKQFEDIVKKREEISSSAGRQVSSKSGTFSRESGHLRESVEHGDKQTIHRRILRRTNTMRELVTSHVLFNKKAPLLSSRRNNIKNVCDDMTRAEDNQQDRFRSGYSKRTSPKHVLPKSSNVEKDSTECKRLSLHQHSEANFRFRFRNRSHGIRRQSMVPMTQLRRAKSNYQRFTQPGEVGISLYSMSFAIS